MSKPEFCSKLYSWNNIYWYFSFLHYCLDLFTYFISIFYLFNTTLIKYFTSCFVYFCDTSFPFTFLLHCFFALSLFFKYWILLIFISITFAAVSCKSFSILFFFLYSVAFPTLLLFNIVAYKYKQSNIKSRDRNREKHENNAFTNTIWCYH